MKAVRHIKTIALVSIFAAAAWLIAPPRATHAHGEEATDTSSVSAETVQLSDDSEPAATAEPSSDTTAVYEYVAQPGDSYTLMARKALQTYGLKYSATITEAKIIFAETHMTLDASSPKLEVGQKVMFKETDVKTWFDKAAGLDAPTEALWNYYVQFANFNTDHVGQP